MNKLWSGNEIIINLFMEHIQKAITSALFKPNLRTFYLMTLQAIRPHRPELIKWFHETKAAVPKHTIQPDPVLRCTCHPPREPAVHHPRMHDCSNEATKWVIKTTNTQSGRYP